MIAATKGFLEQVKILVEKGSDVNSKTRLGASAVTRAAENGQIEVERLLIGQGAEINHKDANVAKKAGHPRIE